MEPRRVVRLSKYLSKHLRHQPQRLGLTLAPGGWVSVDALLAACAQAGVVMSREELEQVVAQNDKRRFSFDATATMIRANQGHSVPVDLGLEPVDPPAQLFHGTGAGAVASILREGLHRMGRHHVHLSGDAQTARRVGARHGRPVVFAVDAGAMTAVGHLFFRSDNGVWLTEEVPPAFLRRLAG